MTPKTALRTKARAKAPVSATVRIPGTTSNLGPGFDTLGVALRTYNFVTVREVETGGDVTSASGPVDEGGRAMVREAAALFFERARRRPFGFEVALRGDVPVARGMGSSVTVRLGVMAALNQIAGARLTPQELLDAVTALEHHPDNAAPALYGGFTVAGMAGAEVRCLRFEVGAAWRFVALIPDFEISTEAARRLVPPSFSKADTVHNLNRAAFISAAFASGRYETLRGMFEDRVHQPYREKLLPSLSAILKAGENAGAIGGWLSGSGSTVICLARSRTAKAVAAAMRAQLPGAQMRILGADNDGLRLV